MTNNYEFKFENGTFILQTTRPDDSRRPFEIKEEELEFDVAQFYEYVFADFKEETHIVVENKINESCHNRKIAEHLYGVIVEICKSVEEELNADLSKEIK